MGLVRYLILVFSKIFVDFYGQNDIYSFFLFYFKEKYLLSLLPITFLIDIVFDCYLGTFFLIDFLSYYLYKKMQQYSPFFNSFIVLIFFRSFLKYILIYYQWVLL